MRIIWVEACAFARAAGRGAGRMAMSVTVLGLAASCASVDTGRVSDGAQYYRGHAQPGTHITSGVRDLLAANGLAGADDFTLATKTARRAEIAPIAPPVSIVHENEFGDVAASKTGNLLAGDVSEANPIIRVQNSFSNNGGWRETEGGAFAHAYSGMTCQKQLTLVLVTSEESGEPIRAALTGIQVYDDTGADTSCNYESPENGIYLTFYASKWPDVSLEEHYGGALKNIADNLDIKSGTTLTIAETTSGKNKKSSLEAETKAAAYLLEPINDVTYKSALWLNKTGDWHVKTRATFPVAFGRAEPQFSPVELLAAIMHAVKISEVDQYINEVQTVDVSG